MITTRSARIAFWLLERLGPQRDFVFGDIAERFEARGQSSAWLWRQVLATITIGAFRDIRKHPLLALATVAVGFALIQSYAVFIGAPILDRVLRRTGAMDVATQVWPVWSVGFVAVGAIIARMSRPTTTPGSNIHKAPRHAYLLKSARTANSTWMAKQVPWALTLARRPCSSERNATLLPENPRIGSATTRFHSEISSSQPKIPTPRIRWSTRSPAGT